MNTERVERVWDVAFVQELTRQQELAIRSGVAISVDIACAAADAAIESLRASGRVSCPSRPSTQGPPDASVSVSDAVSGVVSGSGSKRTPGTAAHLRPLVEQLKRVIEDADEAYLKAAGEHEKLWARVQEVADLLDEAIGRRD